MSLKWCPLEYKLGLLVFNSFALTHFALEVREQTDKTLNNLHALYDKECIAGRFIFALDQSLRPKCGLRLNIILAVFTGRLVGLPTCGQVITWIGQLADAACTSSCN